MSQISPFVPSAVFREDAQSRLRYTYIDPVVRAFFRAREMDVPREIAPSETITEVDFKQASTLKFKYFYDIVMQGVEKNDGSISHAAYTLTFDPTLCPLTCDKTGTRYGQLCLAGHPVLYYILLDLPTLISKLRQHKDLKPDYSDQSS